MFDLDFILLGFSKKQLLILSFFFFIFINTAVTQPPALKDSLYYSSLLKTSIHKIITSKDSTLWIIACNNQEKLIKIEGKGVIEDMTTKNILPKDISFSDILCLNNSRILIGTKTHYIYLLKNNKALWLNEKYGLKDSVIEKFDYLHTQRLIVVSTPHTRYFVKNDNQIRNIQFIELKDTLSTFEEISYYFRQHFRRSFQKEVLELIGDIDFSFRKDKYLNDKELSHLKEKIQTGDIILRRNEMLLTNIGIPGFYTHSGIYIGDADVLDIYFDGLPMLNKQKPSGYILENYPLIYQHLIQKKHPVIEAVAEGVIIEPLEHIANADYLAVLRPLLDKESLFKSLLTAFEYYGYDYDFLFDFGNDNELVCSELLYLSLRPHHDKKGILFKMSTYEGRPFLPPNDIAAQYSKEVKEKNKQFDFIYFFDAPLYIKKGTSSNENEFCKSWKRK